VLSRTDRARRADPSEPAVRLEVRLTRAGGKVHGELRLLDDEGRSDLRRVDGATCDEVAAALSLTASLALVSSMRASPRPAVTAPTSVTGAAPQAAPSFSPAPTTSTPTPSQPATPAVVAPPFNPLVLPPPRPLEAKVPAASLPVPVVSTSTAAPTETRPFRLQIAAGPAIGRVISPGVTVGGTLSSRIARSADSGLAPSLGLSLVHLRNDVIVPSRDVIVTWTALAATLCPGWGFQDRVTVEACGLGLAGWLTAADVGVNVRNAIGRVWVGAGIDVRAAASIGRGFELQADAALHIPFITRRFITTTPAEMVGESSRVAGILGLALAHPL
jgi:hypothetical protein